MRNLLIFFMLCSASSLALLSGCPSEKTGEWSQTAQRSQHPESGVSGKEVSNITPENAVETESTVAGAGSQKVQETEPVDKGPAEKKTAEKNPMAELMQKNIKDARGKGERVRTFTNMAVFLKSRRVELTGRIAITHGLIELFACAPGGKEHETVCVLHIEPEEMMLALMLIGLKPTPAITAFEESTAITQGDKVIIHVEWDDTKKGITKHVKRRAEDLIYNVYSGKSMKRAGWVFTGSITVQHPQTKELFLVAKYRKNLIVTLHDPEAILDTPLIEGGDDTTYVAYEKNLPLGGTPILMTILPADN